MNFIYLQKYNILYVKVKHSTFLEIKEKQKTTTGDYSNI